ncbi:ATP-binding protein [Defluviitalea saccharophila]|jgi:serine/threonine-protein kinase RsbW|uniref:ATP-binding protein n=1 Tax=Defluviitalea saccharophila TaxID=879970 RepID=A0ABZ2Y2T5_9FIRM
MNNPKSTSMNQDIIELGLPLNPAYVSAARLTASSIANRMGFDIEDIEDIKAAVSEACTYLIKQYQLDRNAQSTFKIQFMIKDEGLEIQLTTRKFNKDSDREEDGLGILMIEALMDYISISNKDEIDTHIVMMKKLKNS